MKKTYAYHTPSEMGVEKITKLRETASAYDELITEICPESRHRSLSLTALEEALMWAVKAVICNDPESKAEGVTE